MGDTASESSIVISEPTVLSAEVSSKGDASTGSNGFINVLVTGGVSPYSYDWGNDLLQGPSIDGLSTGSYNLMVTDANGCIYLLMSIQIGGENVGACYTPREIITPNDDGFNDFFTFSCINDRPADLQIFDRYGRLVYTHTAYDNSFNGISDSGVVLGEGGYMWVLNIDFSSGERKVMKGVVTLLRDN